MAAGGATMMASTGHTSRQARQSVQRRASTAGRIAAAVNAPVGQVTTQAPQAVQPVAIRTVTRPDPYSREG
jgi:hypothetical protein